MKQCVFVGPSLHGVTYRPASIEFRGPAGHGDIMRAVREDFDRIGLVDGVFGDRPSVWHKEVLHALAEGCQVWGAASMGALRASECFRFGMRPVGAIARRYMTGELIEDADVALLHGPAEVDYLPFTEPLVEAMATIAAMASEGGLSPREIANLTAAAASLHFGDRTVEAMVAHASEDASRRADLTALYGTSCVRLKQADALQLLHEMCRDQPWTSTAVDWDLADSNSLARLRRL